MTVVSSQRSEWSVVRYSFALCAMLFALCGSADAQQQKKIPRIGYLGFTTPTNRYRVDAFRQGLRQLGYAEGKDFVIEDRNADGKLDLLNELVTDLVRLKVDVIVTPGPAPTRAAKEATSTIPIVMAQDPDPVAGGFVANLARPGGNITGLAALAPELSGKRLELLKEIIPKISRVAVLGTSSQPGNAQILREVELAAKAFGVQLQYLDVLNPKDVPTAFRAAGKGQAEAVLFLVGGSVGSAAHRTQIAELAVKNRLPVMYNRREFVEAGGLMTYSVYLNDLDRRAAIYVDKILKGARPADLPIEQPTKFELVINLKVAKRIGLIIPPNVRARADKVIR